MRYTSLLLAIILCMLSTLTHAQDFDIKKLFDAPDIDNPGFGESDFTRVKPRPKASRNGYTPYKKGIGTYFVDQNDKAPKICKELKETLGEAKLTGVDVRVTPTRPNFEKSKKSGPIISMGTYIGATPKFTFPGTQGLAPDVDVTVDTKIVNFACQVEGVPLSKRGAVQLIGGDIKTHEPKSGGKAKGTAKGPIYVPRGHVVRFREKDLKKSMLDEIGEFTGTKKYICRFTVHYVVKVNGCPVTENYVNRSFSGSLIGYRPIIAADDDNTIKYRCGVPQAGGTIGPKAFETKEKKIGYRTGPYVPGTGFEETTEKTYRVAMQTPEMCVGTTYSITDTLIKEGVSFTEQLEETIVVVPTEDVVTEEQIRIQMESELVSLVSRPEFVTIDPYAIPQLYDQPTLFEETDENLRDVPENVPEVTKTPTETPEETPSTPDLGLAKALAVILADGRTGTPVEDVVLKALAPEPPLPGEGAEVILTDSDFNAASFFEQDVDGGITEEDGEILLTSLDFDVSDPPDTDPQKLKSKRGELIKKLNELYKEINDLRRTAKLSPAEVKAAQKIREDAYQIKLRNSDLISRADEERRTIEDVRKDKDMAGVDKEFADAAEKLFGGKSPSCCVSKDITQDIQALKLRIWKRLSRDAENRVREFIDTVLSKDKDKAKQLTELKEKIDNIHNDLIKNQRAQKRLAEEKKAAEEKNKAEKKAPDPGVIEISDDLFTNDVGITQLNENGTIDIVQRPKLAPLSFSENLAKRSLVELVTMSVEITELPSPIERVEMEMRAASGELANDVRALAQMRDALILQSTESADSLDAYFTEQSNQLYKYYALLAGEAQYNRLMGARHQTKLDQAKLSEIAQVLERRFEPEAIQAIGNEVRLTIAKEAEPFDAGAIDGERKLLSAAGIAALTNSTPQLVQTAGGAAEPPKIAIPVDTQPMDQTVIAMNVATVEAAIEVASLNPILSSIITNAFMVGTQPFIVVATPRSETEAVRTYAEESTTISWFEPDWCRMKEAEDPYFHSTGLWDQEYDDQWAVKQVGLSEPLLAQIKADTDAKEVIVAVIDTGSDWTHPDLESASLWRNPGELAANGRDDDGNGYIDDLIGWNFVEQTNSPWDYDGHGTFVAGVIAAANDNGVGMAGMNPKARIMVLKALDTFGQGHASMIAEAISYAVDNGAQIINMSLGGQNISRIEALAVQHAVDNGVLVIVAAGNSATDVSGYGPAGLSNVITVAATDLEDNQAGFSNFGQEIDIAAPGVNVLSLRARNTDLLAHIRGVTYNVGEGIVGETRAFYRASGTSFAAPIVAGAASILMTLQPDLTADQVRNALLNSARDIETPGSDNFTGYGLLDIAAALAADPDFMIESRITGVEVVQINGKAAIRVIGTAIADQFDEASISLGQGKEPTKWLTVKRRIEAPVRADTLMNLPAAAFRGAKSWTIRLITKHQNGKERESHFRLTLGG